MLLHGFGHSARVWDDLVPALGDGFRTIAIDQRGHGDSERDPEARYSHPDFGRDLEPLTRSFAPGPIALIGHSLGAYGVLHFVDAHPERVCALVLIDAGVELTSPKISTFKAEGHAKDPSFESVAEYERTLERALAFATAERRARLARDWVAKGDDGRYRLKLDPAILLPRRGYDPLGDRSVWAAEETERLWAMLSRLRCPVLVVRGAESRMLKDEIARRMAEDVLHDGRLTVIPAAGHPVMVDNPEALGVAIRSFLEPILCG
jgi:pimeloyl-ACP methyl ester carboxylesterase